MDGTGVAVNGQIWEGRGVEGEMEVVRYWCSSPGVNGGKEYSLRVR